MFLIWCGRFWSPLNQTVPAPYWHESSVTQVTRFALKLPLYLLSNKYYIVSTVLLAITRIIGNEDFTRILPIKILSCVCDSRLGSPRVQLLEHLYRNASAWVQFSARTMLSRKQTDGFVQHLEPLACVRNDSVMSPPHMRSVYKLYKHSPWGHWCTTFCSRWAQRRRYWRLLEFACWPHHCRCWFRSWLRRQCGHLTSVQ
jgi:hypothetical protein